MKSYLSYLKLKFITGLQYRSAALAGMATQIFFGLVYIFIYIAFYDSDTSNVPMPLDQLISYLWLSQIFFSMLFLWYKDKELINLIKSGNIAYELCRPQDIYFMWLSKILGERLSMFVLRALPVTIFACILPSPFNLNLKTTLIRLALFFVVITLSTLLMGTLVVFYHIICLFTLDEKGIVNIFMVISDVLSGIAIPIPFFPKYFQQLANILPFRYTTDFPFRLYIGNISIAEGLQGILIQIIWIIILVVLGRTLMKKALKKAVIQGG